MHESLDDQFAAWLGRGPGRPLRALSAFPLVLALATGCTRPRVDAARLDGHRAEIRTIEVDGKQRSFILAPGSGPRSRQRGLLLVYHGAEGTAQAVLDQTALGLAGVEAGMAVASLDAMAGYRGRWATNPEDLRIVDDVTFTRAVVEAIEKEVRIDSAKVFAVGYSRGGDFVYQLACRAPDLVRAVGAVGATLLQTNRPWCDSTESRPNKPAMAIVLGSSDPLMPWNGGVTTRASAPETADFFARRSRCGDLRTVDSLPGRRPHWRITRTEFRPCASPVALYRVEPLEHLWPGVAFDVERVLISSFLALPRR